MFRTSSFVRCFAFVLLLFQISFSGLSAEAENLTLEIPQELGIQVSVQQQTNWCWAAVTTSLARFYGVRNEEQCKLVDDEIDLQSNLNCCGMSDVAQCNRAYQIPKALRHVGIATSTHAGQQSFVELAQQIQDGHPVVLVLIGSGVADNHYVLLTGVGPNETLIIKDPKDPIGGVTRSIPYAQFTQGYEQRFWKGSFFTQPAVM